jgi:acetolactate synthase-1/3 small subunit
MVISSTIHNKPNLHTIVALVQDNPGVLNRVVSLFRKRAFNIASLAVGASETSKMSRMTIVVEGDDETVEQVTKQLYKLIEVVKVSDISEENFVQRELALIKVHTDPNTRGQVMEIVDIFRANIVDVSQDSLMIEVTGDYQKVESLCDLLKPFGIRELIRTGRIASVRGSLSMGAEISTSSNGKKSD